MNAEETKKTSVIFYGAGEWIKLNYLPISKLGYAPICLIDDDEKKQNTTISLGRVAPQEYEILSLQQAAEKYPSSAFLLTAHPSQWAQMRERLQKSGLVAAQQLLDYPAHLKVAPGCYEMQRRMEIRPALNYCCKPLDNDTGEELLELDEYSKRRDHWGSTPIGTVALDPNDYGQTIDAFFAMRNRDIAQTKEGNIPLRCKSCPNLVEDLWFDRPAVEEMATALGGICQMDCVYCGADKGDTVANERSKNFDLQKFIGILQERALFEDDGYVCLASGEPTLHPNIGAMLEAAKPYYCEILTNSLKYSEPVMELLENGHSSISVSVDSGTRETFKKVKGIDGWQRVCENLEKYASVKGGVVLKYILLPGLNDNYEDADGLLALAKKIHPANIALSSNIYELNESTRLPDRTVEVARYIIRQAKEAGIEIDFLSTFFSVADCQRILGEN